VTFVKVCGMTRAADAQEAARHGANAVGFVFWPGSARYVDPDRAADIVGSLPAGVHSVGVFVNQPAREIERIAARTGISMIQLHGDESASHAADLPFPVIKATSLDAAGATLDEWPEDVVVLLDVHDPVRRGGTGVRIDWTRAAAVAARRRVVLAGGLTPDNVREAIEAVRPYGVDVSSGVEDSPGIKSVDKMVRFLRNVRGVSLG